MFNIVINALLTTNDTGSDQKMKTNHRESKTESTAVLSGLKQSVVSHNQPVDFL